MRWPTSPSACWPAPAAAAPARPRSSCSEETGLNVNVRMGEVETVESTRDRGIAVTVYFGTRKGSASTADLREESLEATVEQACAIARHTEDDPAAGLADADLMATDLREFDSWHPWAVDADRAIDLALAAEAAGREVDARIANSDGASVGSGTSLGVYANSHGFIGRERSTQHSIGCALIAGHGDAMQRDGWYSIALAADDAGGGRGHRPQGRASAPYRGWPRARWPTGEVAGAVLGRDRALADRPSASARCRAARCTARPASWSTAWARSCSRSGSRSRSGRSCRAACARRRSMPKAWPRANRRWCSGGVLQRYVLGSYSARKLGLADHRQRRRRAQPAGRVQCRRPGIDAGAAWAAACWSPS